MSITRVCVVGGGTMGNGIAHVFAQKGFRVTLVEANQALADKALATIAKNMDRQVAKGSLTAADKDAALARLSAAEGWASYGLGYPAADAAWQDMMVGGRNFWMAVHPLFINRELTKNDVREIIRRGLSQTQGSYRDVVELFHLPARDYKRFLAFLSQHDCHLPFHEFRDSA
ncbi:MAG: 3-hydroxyacyl-CoA dehydrogenase NAD-binding domain-containing protein [Elusimicrobiota bacterium]